MGQDHQDAANSKNNLADLLNRLGNYTEAEPLIVDGPGWSLAASKNFTYYQTLRRPAHTMC